jgi:type II secretory pathway component GspD/PulD (secretin)
MAKAQEAMAQGKFEDAEVLSKRAAEIDPNEVAATALAYQARMRRRYETDLAIRNGKEDSVVRMFTEVDKTNVLSKELIERDIDYSKDWRSLTDRRRAMNDRLSYKKDPKDLAIESKLNDVVTVNWDKQPLSQAINYLASYTGLNIVIDNAALAEAGLTDASPVTMTAKDIKLKSVLKLVLRPLGLTYKPMEGVLLITSPQVNRGDLITRYHYVGDLVMGPKQNQNGSQGPMMAGNASNDPNVLRAQAQAMTTNVPVPGMQVNGGGMLTTRGERPDVDFAPLINLIKATIAPGSWRNDESSPDVPGYGMGAGFAGGAGDAPERPIGTITPFFLNISLIIRHTAEVHDDVVDLLRQLRRLQDLQVSIEVRFITVSDSFFEQIGVDFDFAIQSDAFGKKSSAFAPNGAVANLFPQGTTTGTATTTGGFTAGTGTTGTSTSGTGAFLVNPSLDHALGRGSTVVGLSGNGDANLFTRANSNLTIPFQQGTVDNIAPFNAIPNAGATFGLAFLSDLEVYLFLTALQGDSRSNLVQAPKVTTFNGAAASILSANVINYVQSLFPIVGAGAVAFVPTPAQINDGVFMFATPVVSADRRYVRMTLTPTFTTFTGFDTISVPGAVGGGGLGGGATSINATLQLPRFTQNVITTTVTVPDGGTVLLGGVKRLREERKEFGVPILAKTPLINRLFRNIGIGRETDSLMLMVTPRIIILEEEEDRLGIPAVPTINF